MAKKKKDAKIRDMKPIKDAKGGGGGQWSGGKQQQGAGPGRGRSGISHPSQA